MAGSHIDGNSAKFWTGLSVGFAFVSSIGAGVAGYHLGHYYAKNFQANPKIAPIALAITGVITAGSLFFNATSLFIWHRIEKYLIWKGVQNLKMSLAVAALNVAEIGAVGAATIYAYRHLELVGLKGVEYMAWAISAYALTYLGIMAVMAARQKESILIDYT